MDDKRLGSSSPKLSDTAASCPELWSGPAWLAFASRPEHPPAIALSGYRRRLADWEHHLEQTSTTAPPQVPGVEVHTSDPADLLRSGTWTSAELEVLRDTVTDDELAAVVELIATRDTRSVLEALDAPPVPVNANRQVPVTGRLRGAVDLTVPTLPSRREEAGRALAFGSRQVRLVVGPNWFVAAWRSIDGTWDPANVRWPHFGVPSRTASWRAGKFGEHQAPTSHLANFMVDLCEHVEYQLGSWAVEQEMWEQRLFASLAAGPTTFDELDLGPARQELGQLAEFLTLMRRAQRALVRRPHVDPVLASPSVRSVCHKAAALVDERLDASRDRVRESFALLADIAAGEQAHHAERQRAATERVQDTITVVTTVLLVPALVVSVYGANVRELSDGARGDVASLLVLMAMSSVLATVALRAVRARPRRARPVVGIAWIGTASTAVGVTVATGLARGWWQGAAWAAVLAGSVVAAVSAIVGTVLALRQTTERGDS